ncbi:MAG: FAD:protein FMN transferase [Chlorobi bacterium]|nr:FAD:protein FMN transferase [Chlorobiota bacterium]
MVGSGANHNDSKSTFGKGLWQIKKVSIRNSFIFAIVCTGFMVSCSSSSKHGLFFYEGTVMGTTYHVKIATTNPPNAISIDSVLFYVDTLLTTYNKSSELMRVNLSEPGTLNVSKDFAYVFNVARRVWKESEGAFDPTVGPVAWQHGFGPQIHFDTIITGFEYFRLLETDSGHLLIKEMPNVYLDFGGIAKGYGVDKLAWFLMENGHTDFMIEVGGEVRINGTKPDGKHWKIGIENPFEQGEFLYIVSDTNISIATSGTYRQKKKEGDKEVTHIVSVGDDRDRMPDVVLASFMDTSCTYADGWATALVAMGCEAAKKIILSNEFKNVIVVCRDSTTVIKIKGVLQDDTNNL